MKWVIKAGRYFQNKLTSNFLYKIHPTKTLDTKVVTLDASCDIILCDAFSIVSDFNINWSGIVETIIDPDLIVSNSSCTKSGENATVSFSHRFSLFEDETELNFVKMKSTTM